MAVHRPAEGDGSSVASRRRLEQHDRMAVRPAHDHDRARADAGTGGRILEVVGVELAAGHHEHVVAAADHVELAVVHEPQVHGGEPTVGAHRHGVVGVAVEHRRTSHLDRADAATGDAHTEAGQGPAHAGQLDASPLRSRAGVPSPASSPSRSTQTLRHGWVGSVMVTASVASASP